MTNIADGLSLQLKDTPRQGDNGSNWTMNPDWEEQAGLVFEVNQVVVNSDTSVLMKHFKDEPVLKGIVEALQDISMGLDLCECKRAHHHTANYMIKGQKLWYVGSGTPMRSITQRECVTQREAIKLA